MNAVASKPYAAAASPMVSKRAIVQPTQAMPRRAIASVAAGQPAIRSAMVV